MSSYIFGEVTLQDSTGSTATITASGLNVNVQNFPATQPVSGSVSVSNFPASQAVTGTFYQATQPVSATALPLPTGAATETTLSALNAKVTTVNTGAVVVSSSALPTGASTEATLSTLNNKITDDSLFTPIASIDAKTPTLVSGRQPVDGSGVTQPISAVSLPLPTGASTSANQTTTNTNLTNIYTRQSDKSQFTKLTDGTNNVAVEAVNALKTTLPLGTKIELEYYIASLSTTANYWVATGKEYTIPAGYKFELTRFSQWASNGNAYARVSSNLLMGTFNTSTNVFTNGDSTSAPDFYGIVEARVTTALSNTATTLTVTYVNQDGVGGRTGKISLPASAPLNYRYALKLQAGDIGVRDITNVTDSANPTGVVALYGTKQLCIGQFTSNTFNTGVFTKQTVVCDAGEILSIDIGTTSGTAYSRRTSFMGNLIAY